MPRRSFFECDTLAVTQDLAADGHICVIEGIRRH
ncbi:uncharacterized protein METZ01_LOCUS306822, partial [marine metagenome]